MSNRACVGCAWAPSPALITCPSNACAIRCGKPGSEWRTTATQMPSAPSVIAVSSSVSPFVARLRFFGARFTTSAPSRSSARLNDANVRVLSSKNMLTHAILLSSGPGGSRSNCAVRSNIYASSSALRSSRSIKLRRIRTDCNLVVGGDLRCQSDLDALLRAGRNEAADVIGLDGQLAQAAVNEHAEPDRRRPAKIGDRIERRPNRPASVENVVADDDEAPRYVQRDL